MLAFMTKHGEIYTDPEGSIIEYEHGRYLESPIIEPIFHNMYELKIVINLLKVLFPNGWEIYNNNIMGIEQAQKLKRESIPKKEEGTFILAFMWNGKERKDYQTNIYYKDFETFKSLPDAAKSDVTKKDYEKFWKQYKK